MVILNKIYTYDELIQCIKDLECRFSDILTLTVVGMSHDERIIPMLQLGTAKECLICSAGIHGRESINPILMLKIIEDYCIAYESGDADSVYSSIQKNSICFLPLINPDGYEIALSGYLAIRNPILRHSIMMDGIPSAEWKSNGRGVDINRNFPCRSFSPRGRMLHAASENESKAMIEVFRDFSNSIGYIDFHSRGQIIYYFRNAMSSVFNEEGEKYARYFQGFSHYEIGGKTDEFEDLSSGGNSVNYYSERYRRQAITVETVEDEAKFPLDPAYQMKTYEEIKKIPLAFLEEYQK